MNKSLSQVFLSKSKSGLPQAEALLRMAEAINAAERVTFLCGIGCAGAKQDIIALAERVEAPIVYTLRAKDLMEHDNGCAVGMTGMLGWGAAPLAVSDCDLLIMWGTDFPHRRFLPCGGNVIQVDTDAAALGRRVPLLLGIQADAGATARALLPLISDHRDGDYLCATRERHSRLVHKLNRPVVREGVSGTLRPEYLMRLVSDYAEPDAVFATDSGAPMTWAARYLQMNGRRRFLGGAAQGGMAYAAPALPVAIGAKEAQPTRQVIALCGQSGLASLPEQAALLLQKGLAVKVLVFNPSAHDYAAMAQGLGMAAFSLDNEDAAPAAVKAWLAIQRPALLDAKTI